MFSLAKGFYRFTPSFFRSCYTLSHQHVIQSHELGIRWIFLLHMPVGQDGLLLNLAQHAEQCRLHPVAVQGVLTCLSFIQGFLSDGEYLV